ncbi:MAG: hypothetical protein AAGM84_11440 [Pseudomonadota bacterium]
MSGTAFFARETLQERLNSIDGYDKSKDPVTGKVRKLAIHGAVTNPRVLAADPDGGDPLATLARIHNKVYLEWERDAEGKATDSVKRIGYWGQCLALVVLWSLVRERTDPQIKSVGALADAILESSNLEPSKPLNDRTCHEFAPGDPGRSKPDDWQALLKPKTDKTKPAIPVDLRDLLQRLLYGRTNHVMIPPIKWSKRLRDATAEFVIDRLRSSKRFGGHYREIGDWFDGEDHDCPTRCFWALTRLLNIDDEVMAILHARVPDQIGPSWMESQLYTYVMADKDPLRSDGVDDLGKHVNDAHFYLCQAGADQRSPITMLTGQRHNGKKAIVGDLLRKLAQEGKKSDVRLTLRPEGREVKLPVFCITATASQEAYDEIDLSLNVLIFLERLAQEPNAVPSAQQTEAVARRRADMERLGTTPSLRPLLDEIARLHANHPALFVFNDANEHETTDIHLLIRRVSVRALLETLLESNQSGSRFLLTNNDVSAWLKDYTPNQIKVTKPNLRRLAWYIGKDNWTRVRRAVEEEKGDAFLNKGTSGDSLMLLGALHGQPDLGTKGLARKIPKWFGKKTKSDIRKALTDALLDSWQAEGFLPVIALLLAADDGLMPSTIEACLKTWRMAEPNRPLPSTDQVNARLWQIHNLCNEFFLTWSRPTTAVREEARFDEIGLGGAQDDPKWRVYAFDPRVAEQLTERMWQRSSFKTLMRRAYRLIADQAQSRARYRLLRGGGSVRPKGGDLPERSVQALVRLLLSLEPDWQKPAGRKEPSVPLSTAAPRVFSIRKDADRTSGAQGAIYDQHLAIKYAYHVLLRGEADKDHRMSMSLDSDLLRLGLYTLLVTDPGRADIWDPRALRRNRDTLPKGLQAATLAHLSILSVKDRAHILTSLGLSAFYTQHRWILRWAEVKLWQLWNMDVGNPDVRDGLSRVIAARVDYEVNLLRPLTPKPKAKTPREDEDIVLKPAVRVFSDVLERLNADLRLLCPKYCVDRNAALAARGDGSEAAAALRLEVRLLHVRSLLDAEYAATEQWDELRLTENALREAKDISRPMITHGRSGRTLFRALSGDFPILHPKSGTQWCQSFPMPKNFNLRTFIHANVSRLDTYSGAERVMSLIDHAQRHVFLGELAIAVSAATEARRICYIGTASDHVRLNVLCCDAIVHMALLECHFEEGRDPDSLRARLDPVRIRLNHIHDIADAHEFRLYLAYQHSLVARFQRLSHALHAAMTTGEQPPDAGQADAKLMPRIAPQDRKLPKGLKRRIDLVEQELSRPLSLP